MTIPQHQFLKFAEKLGKEIVPAMEWDINFWSGTSYVYYKFAGSGADVQVRIAKSREREFLRKVSEIRDIEYPDHDRLGRYEE